MTDLISRSAAIDIINEERRFAEELRRSTFDSEDRAHNMGQLGCAIGLSRKIKELPALDAVPVVRCRDCAHWKPCEVKGFEGKKYCEWAGWLVGENAYCVYGEVKSNAAD